MPLITAPTPTPTTALFDFDGTLLASLHFWVEAFRDVFAELGVTMTLEETEERCLHSDFDTVAARFGVCSATELEQRMHERLPAAYLPAELYDGSRDVLERCIEHGIRVGLVTSSPRSLMHEVLERLGIATLFEVVVCGNDLPRMKPHPDPLHRALGSLGVAAREALMIGDTAADVLAGRAAGTATALRIPTDASDAEKARLRALRPDHEYAHLREVLPLLGLT